MIRDELIQLANENLDIDLSDVQMNTKLSDLDIDSIDMLDFIMLLEEKYNIEFAEDELDEIETLGDIAELIESKNWWNYQKIDLNKLVNLKKGSATLSMTKNWLM